MDFSLAQSALQELPPEVLQLFSLPSNENFLSRSAFFLLDPKLTDDVIIHFESLLVELCARANAQADDTSLLPMLGRLLPFAPYLAELIAAKVLKVPSDPPDSHKLQRFLQSCHTYPDAKLCEILLGIFRLLVADLSLVRRFIHPPSLQSLLFHSNRAVRYLSVRILCLHVGAADAAMQLMLKNYLGDGAVSGGWDGKMIDYRFLSLWEEKRSKIIDQRRTIARRERRTGFTSVSHTRQFSPQEFFAVSACVGGVLIPRLTHASVDREQSSLVHTGTISNNLTRLAEALLQPQPLLLAGLAGAGKTLLVNHAAQTLDKLDSLVVLHLNEQSDAKLLLGMYTTGTAAGTFSWQPGVLTTAVKEGRWVLIEDLDRAPNEVISTLLPLIEHGEVRIPGRGEVIKAARGFKIIATTRTNLNLRNEEVIPASHMLGSRFWRKVHIDMPSTDELREVVQSVYPKLGAFSAQIMAVYSEVQSIRQSHLNGTIATNVRPLSPRDLLKWCDRLTARLSGQHISDESMLDEAFLDSAFLEGVDCFGGSLQSDQGRAMIAATIAEQLHIDPTRRDHIMQGRRIEFGEVAPQKLQVGRVVFQKKRSTGRVAKLTRQRPFAKNAYTLRLLERIAAAVERAEPLLLVGETGTGKTTTIQQLAESLGRKLMVFNLSQQSESGDLLGGFKPVNVRSMVLPLKEEFETLFSMSFSRKSENTQRTLEKLNKRVAKADWRRVCEIWRAVVRTVTTYEFARGSRDVSPAVQAQNGDQPTKRRKVNSEPSLLPTKRWHKFEADLTALEAQLSRESSVFAFTFIEGSIVKAVRNGDWILLDEINLASPDTLEALADLFAGGPDGAPSIMLTEAGNVQRIKAHPDFRIFAAMNPATDVGKKDLPPGIRSRFTEIYVDSPDKDNESLKAIVESYLGSNNIDIHLVTDVTNLYREVQDLLAKNVLVDGATQKPTFSLRTLTRTLTFAQDIAPLTTLRRALYEGFCMSFLTFLDKTSENILSPIIKKHICRRGTNSLSELKRPLRRPSDDHAYVKEGHFWLRQGTQPVEEQPHYIITDFVRRNMDNLIRAASTLRYPVLIQGPTSSGKTSMINYLAKKSGNKFVRINNHEHTDLQEYLGSYVSGDDGQLHFQEGVLVRALREGHWIVLDELNLAPTDVLEALNRLLDDNRELLIPETQEIVRPHQNFMLFATQNPAGLYGGRKTLSRAFRNRFLELHFDDIPVDELNTILSESTRIPPTWCRRIVKVYQELSTLRQESRLFEQKSFATLRDLFRWARRKADTSEELAINGFMLLAERVRKSEERDEVRKVIERVISQGGPPVKISEGDLYDTAKLPEASFPATSDASPGTVWTKAMRRLFTLVAHAIRNNEPILLVGETGCGKTTVCQMLADALGTSLHTVNAHQNMETGDLIGAQRPVRNRADVETALRQKLLEILPRAGFLTNAAFDTKALLQTYDEVLRAKRSTLSDVDRSTIGTLRQRATALFEWADGNLVHAMKQGHFFLLDEISLADDSVLERLNSVLESGRTLLLAEKGSNDVSVTANDGFQFLATMNPGGDYGKRELSPALRNRFTEIWVPSLSDTEDILQIVEAKLVLDGKRYAPSIVSFAKWFNDRYNASAASAISIRDALAWVAFLNRSIASDWIFRLVHGAAIVYIDTLGANPAAIFSISAANIDSEREKCLHHLSKLLNGVDVQSIYHAAIEATLTPTTLHVGAFSLPIVSRPSTDASFSFGAKTTTSNAMRVLRAMSLPKPILLEGNPGVGKTTLITAIARAVGQPLFRINLSEQTDLMDLLGSDMPVEGASAGIFAWRDAPFLKAMKEGGWVLLDEMNLASQSVLEGLNACLDHRGEVYISELDLTVRRHPDFRIFAAQNPHHQGGGRKGLPASFVNRFTVVYADVFRPDDLMHISSAAFQQVQRSEIEKLIRFISALEEDTVQQKSFGGQGSPWEFNLRDILRWLQLRSAPHGLLPNGSIHDYLNTVITQRFRTSSDQAQAQALFTATFGPAGRPHSYYHNLSSDSLQVGLGLSLRASTILHTSHTDLPPISTGKLPVLESLMICIQQSWPVILVGPPGSGKSLVLKQLSATVGAELVTFSMNADIDAMDLVGGFEQVDPSRRVHQFLAELGTFVRDIIVTRLAHSQHTYNGNVVTNGANDHHHEVLRSAQRLLTLLDENSIDSAWSITVLEALQVVVKAVPSAQAWLDRAQELLHASQGIEHARFEWVDGLLVQAIERGQWLVLDNANLCSSSVLDRLNSLLEPNGYLSINEHPSQNGEPKIVTPHPNFRVFLTMDPRFGELSRAMRNRAVELCLLPEDGDYCGFETKLPSFPFESLIYRFRSLDVHDTPVPDSDRILHIALDHLSLSDTALFTKKDENVEEQALLPWSRVPSTQQKLEMRCSWPNRRVALQLYESYMPSGVSDFNHAQPVYTINNAPLTCPTQELDEAHDRPTALCIALIYDVYVETERFRVALQDIADGAEKKHVRSMTPLEKSLVPGRKQKGGPDMTAASGVGPFLERTIHEIYDTVKYESCYYKSPDMTRALADLLVWYGRLFHMVHFTAFDPAAFGVLLQIFGQNLAVAPILPTLKASIAAGLNTIRSAKPLTTGLSMERLWSRISPVTPPSQDQLEELLRLETLADRFDASLWKFGTSLTTIVQVRNALSKAIHTVSTYEVDASDLVYALEQRVTDLEATVPEDHIAAMPYLELEFESLCQHLAALPLQDEPDKALELWSVLAARPTKTQPARTSSSAGLGAVKSMSSDFLGYGQSQGAAARGALGQTMMSKLHKVGEVPLSSLNLLQSELDTVGNALAKHASSLCSSHARMLQAMLNNMMIDVWKYHADLFLTATDAPAIPDLAADLPENHYFRPIWSKYLQGCYSLSDKSDAIVLGRSWINFALGMIKLYVPNQPFDPALRPQVERDLYDIKLHGLTEKLGALKKFEEYFTGRSDTYRIRLVEDDINDMGAEPQVPGITRPPDASEMNTLQAEFKRVLQEADKVEILIQRRTVDQAESQLVQQNLTFLVERLSGGYAAYRDITQPLVGILHCLQIGLMLSTTSTIKENSVQKHLLARTPLMETSLLQMITADPMLAFDRKLPLDLRWHALRTAAVGRCIDDQVKSGSVIGLMGDVQDLFMFFYEDWTDRLQQERQEEAKMSSLYAFQGAEETETADEDHAHHSMFPTYEDEGEHGLKPFRPKIDSRSVATQLSDLHRAIFAPDNDPSARMKELLLASSETLIRLWSEEGGSATPPKLQSLLPALLLLVQDKSRSAQASLPKRGDYNVYTDANIQEATKLSQLVRKVQQRFRQINRAWPEHAIPIEVLTSCNGILLLPHSEPVMKFLAKAERLHAIIYEWQKMASREFSAASLYDEITSLLISWRQLELTTWSRLFDIETQKAAQDGKAWWFVAYENIIAIPQAMREEGVPLGSHVKDLLRALESFVKSTVVGQYSSRLQLLSQFRQQAQEIGGMNVVHAALDNFIRYFSRFEQSVADILSKGREKLQKEINDIIKLASWKDTTIDALRQSAMASHRKLYRLVRKFRDVLNQPVDALLAQGPPDITMDNASATVPPSVVATIVDSHAVHLCEHGWPTWQDRPERFKNIPNTVARMSQIRQDNKSGTTGADYIDDFLSHLESSMGQLHKATPKTLTAENEDTVKHLKTQKRKLFADTLKELRKMGLKSNVSGDVLMSQASLSTALAGMPLSSEPMSTLGNHVTESQYHLHKTLHLMTQVRQLSREHSEDLTGAEVARSTAYLEGLLHTSLKQTHALADGLQQMKRLDSTLQPLSATWAPDKYDLIRAEPEITDQLLSRREVVWLATVADVLSGVVDTQANLGRFDATLVLDALRGFSKTVLKQIHELTELPAIVSGAVTSTSHTSALLTISMARDSLVTQLAAYGERLPQLNPVLEHIKPWLGEYPAASTIGDTDLIVENAGMLQNAVKAADTVLTVIQGTKTSANKQPSAEKSRWLLSELEDCTEQLKTFGISKVSERMQKMLQTLAATAVDGDDDVKLTRDALKKDGATVAYFLPIFKQYQLEYTKAIRNFAQLHLSICKMSHRLAKAFVQIGTQGFCTPSEKSEDQSNSNEKLESGTGLGEGEGAEDISKDIEDDEDLSELAQQADKEGDKEDIEDEKDAVDMADEDMEGEMDDVDEKSGDEGDAEDKDAEDEMDEEVGNVDDLGANTVDEKMWDEPADEQNKDKEGDQSQGQREDEQAAGKEGHTKEDGQYDGGEDGEREDDELDQSVDEAEALDQNDVEKTDPHLEEKDNLELPDELDLGDEKGERSEQEDGEELGDLDEMDGKVDEEEVADKTEEAEADKTSEAGDGEPADADAEDETMEDDVDGAEAEAKEERVPLEQDTADIDETQAAKDPSIGQQGEENMAESGAGADAHEQDQQQEDTAASSTARENGEGTEATEQAQAAAEQGDLGRPQKQDAVVRQDDALQDAAQNEAFKKLGDTLEQWYNQQRQIHEASKDESKAQEQLPQDVNMANAEFEHLPADDTQPDTQALGAASADQAKAVDERNAISANEPEAGEENEAKPLIDDTDPQPREEDDKMDTSEDHHQEADERENDREAGQHDFNAFVGQPRDAHEQQHEADLDGVQADDEILSESEVSEVDNALSNIDLDSYDSLPRPAVDARALWSQHESSTRTLSLMLTEQLRLILEPTVASKLHGDFRTGKRLNLKRIIPYIASSYKRDKIWLRRSQPSKRSYQIMLALDDSRSMYESQSESLAFETLALVSKALSQLEVGELSIVGFGETVNVAHPFGQPFSSDAGAEVFRHFGFQQKKTDVKKLVNRAIEIFREARMQSMGRGAQDLWQLGMIISDGVCEDHQTILRLVRQAQAERIMLVFVIVDAAASSAAHVKTDDGAASSSTNKSQSILDLQTVEFTSDNKVVRKKYLDTFPFRWYLVVRDVEELPGVLATALRQWFTEVVDTAG